jgi:competence protein ComEA
METQGRFWTAVILVLVMVIAAGGLIIWSKLQPSQPLEIVLPPAPELRGEITITGAIKVPGIYPLRSADCLEAVIQSAGGITPDAAPGKLTLYIPLAAEEPSPQKIDINRAEAWLLKALPDIGEARAKAIIAYRNEHGRFAHISDLLKVEGISTATLEKIKDLITVAE